MDSCKITKRGLIAVRWNGDTRTYDEFKPSHPLALLSRTCEVEEGVTLLDLFNAVEFSELMAVMSAYSSCPVREFHAQIHEPFTPTEVDPTEFIEIYRVAEVFKGSLSIWEDFHLVKPSETCEHCGRNPLHGHYYSISYTPLNEIAHLPIKINKKVYFTKMSGDEILLEVDEEFTLLEVLNAIYYDISFHGGPEDNKKFLKEMAETTEKIRSGEIKTERISDWRDLFTDEEES